MHVKKTRNFLFDNLKALLIFLVIFGHILELFLKNSNFQLIYSVIYSFHMPAFVFIAGYFAKNIEKQENSLVFDFLFPYVIINSLYQIIVFRSLTINLFLPNYVYWYLLSLFFWKLLLKKIIQIRFVFLFSILLSLYCGFFDDVSRYLSISRTLVFLPYFLAGYFFKEETISDIKKKSKFFGIILFSLALSVVLIIFKNDLIPFEILKGADSYKDLHLSLFIGFLSRIVLLIIGLAFIISFINLISEKEFKLTYIGKRTLVIYLLHPFFIPIVKKIDLILEFDNQYYGIIICLLITASITMLLSIRQFTEYYNYFFSGICKIFDKKHIIN